MRVDWYIRRRFRGEEGKSAACGLADLVVATARGPHSRSCRGEGVSVFDEKVPMLWQVLDGPCIGSAQPRIQRRKKIFLSAYAQEGSRFMTDVWQMIETPVPLTSLEARDIVSRKPNSTRRN